MVCTHQWLVTAQIRVDPPGRQPEASVVTAQYGHHSTRQKASPRSSSQGMLSVFPFLTEPEFCRACEAFLARVQTLENLHASGWSSVRLEKQVGCPSLRFFCFLSSSFPSKTTDNWICSILLSVRVTRHAVLFSGYLGPSTVPPPLTRKMSYMPFPIPGNSHPSSKPTGSKRMTLLVEYLPLAIISQLIP